MFSFSFERKLSPKLSPKSLKIYGQLRTIEEGIEKQLPARKTTPKKTSLSISWSNIGTDQEGPEAISATEATT